MTKNSAPIAVNSDQKQLKGSCLCGSGQTYILCCQPAIDGSRPAVTAESLMRSRYCAYALGEVDYLITTTHIDHRTDLSRQSLLEHHQHTRWLGLTILNSEAGQATDTAGKVHFVARFAEIENGRCSSFGTLQENSNFKQIDNRWYYCDGEVLVKPFKPERNLPCPCGSMRKFKKCCG